MEYLQDIKTAGNADPCDSKYHQAEWNKLFSSHVAVLDLEVTFVPGTETPELRNVPQGHCGNDGDQPHYCISPGAPVSGVSADSLPTDRPPKPDYRTAISDTCDRVKQLLLAKNASYGNSAFEPIGIMSKLGAREGILQRIDDKLQRLKNGHPYPGDDTILDVAGYFLLLLTFDSLELK